MTRYKDKPKEFAAYRMAFMFGNLVLLMVTTIVVAFAVPDIPQLAMCSVCGVLIVISLGNF